MFWNLNAAFVWARVLTLWMWVSCVRHAFQFQQLVFFIASECKLLYFLFFVVRYSLNLLSKRHHFGHVGGPDPNVIFSLWKIAPSFTGRDREWQARMTKDTVLTIRELLSNQILEFDNQWLFKKPEFFFGDAMRRLGGSLWWDYKWLRQISSWWSFMPNMEWMFSLSCLQSMSLHRQMDWELTKAQSGVAIRRISNRGAFPIGHNRDII